MLYHENKEVDQYGFKNIAVYFDKFQNLIGVPTTIVENHAFPIYINNIAELSSPYSNEELEMFLRDVFDRCYSMAPIKVPGKPALETYLKVPYRQAILDKGCVTIFWSDEDGYVLSPTWKFSGKKDSFFMRSQRIHVPTHYFPGEFAMAFLEAIKLSFIESSSKEPQ